MKGVWSYKHNKSVWHIDSVLSPNADNISIQYFVVKRCLFLYKKYLEEYTVSCNAIKILNIEIKSIYKFQVYSAKNLLTYCEGFILQNLVALLTYDDSVKRLIFGKKLQNHDVITGRVWTWENLMRSDIELTLMFRIAENAARKGQEKRA